MPFPKRTLGTRGDVFKIISSGAGVQDFEPLLAQIQLIFDIAFLLDTNYFLT